MATFEELYPFQSNAIDIDGMRYHYLDEGEGPVLLMLHGNPTWSFYYRELIQAFRGKFRCIVPDHIGCGYSDKPQHWDYRLSNHIANVERLLEHLQVDKYTLVCHDWGGPIGFGVSVKRPQDVERLVVFNTTCLVTNEYPKRILLCRIPLLGSLAIRGLNFFTLAAVKYGIANPDRFTPEIKAGLLKPYDSWHNRVANIRFVQDIPLSDDHPSWETAKGVESQLGVLKDKPMLLCWGKQDFCFDDFFLEAWQRDFPHAETHVFDHGGHYVVQDCADEIIPLMDTFLGT